MPMEAPFGEITKGGASDINPNLLWGQRPLRVRNISLRRGGISHFSRFEQLVSLSLGSGEALSFIQWLPYGGSAGKLYVFSTAGNGWQVDPVAGGATALSNTVSGTVHSIVMYRNWIIVATTANMYRIDGTTVHVFQIPTPAAPTAAAGSSGNLSGTYKYRVSFVSKKSDGTGELEGVLGAESNAVTVSNQQINLSGIPTGGSGGVVARKIYRYGGTLAEWYLVATINDNTTTTYTDNLSDAAASANALADTAATNLPTVSEAVTVYQNRLWVAQSPTRLWWSKSGQIVTHTATMSVADGGFIEVGFQDGQKLVALEPLPGSLGIVKQKSTWLLSGETPDSFALSKVANVGAAERISVASGAGSLFVASDTDIYEINASQVNALMAGVYQKDYKTYVPTPKRLVVAPISQYLFCFKEDTRTTDPYGTEDVTVLGTINAVSLDMAVQGWWLMGQEEFATRDASTDGSNIFIATATRVQKWNILGDLDVLKGSAVVSGVRVAPEGMKAMLSGYTKEGTFPASNLSVTTPEETTNISLTASSGNKYARLWNPLRGRTIQVMWKTNTTARFTVGNFGLDIDERGVL